MRPSDLPPFSRWATRPHGTRLRYMSGCKCMQCRAANSRHETTRAALRKVGLGNGIVCASAARAHIARLGTRQMGYKQVARVAGVAISVVAAVKAGRKLRIRQETDRRIRAVAWQPALGALVDAGPTWVLLNELIATGYPKRRLAHWLGQRGQGLQVSRRHVKAQTAMCVRALHRRLTAESEVA